MLSAKSKKTGLGAIALKPRPVLAVAANDAVKEYAFLGMVRIQALKMDGQLLQQLTDKLGALPEPGNLKQHQDWRIHWLTPVEYLVVVEEGGEQKVMELLADLPLYVSVISDSRVTLSLSGTKVPELLAQRCALDLHPGVFLVGCSTVTRMTGLPVMVSRMDRYSYEVTTDRSYGHYLWDWLRCR